MWNISKDFFLEYGHRVWSQELTHSLCSRDDTKCACRHLHGHSGKVTIHLEGAELERGMVTDFKHLGFMKDFIDDYLDHKMIIDKNDPAFMEITGGNIMITTLGKTLILQSGERIPMIAVAMANRTFGYVLDLKNSEDTLTNYQMELLEGFFIVDFLPTSEALAKFIADVAGSKINGIPGVRVESVVWNETPKSHAQYKV